MTKTATAMKGAVTSLPRLKVWWIPQVPGKPFEIEVTSFVVAKTLLTTLAAYDLFQLEHHIKPDFSNAGGLSIFEGGDWTDYYTADGDEDIDGLTLEQCAKLDQQFATE